MEKDFELLRELLETQETFPLDYILKFIGHNNQRFTLAVAGFEKAFPKAKLQTARLSKGDAHLALTYHFLAQNPDEVVELMRAAYLLEDVLVVL